jgi:hypothetical protein
VATPSICLVAPPGPKRNNPSVNPSLDVCAAEECCPLSYSINFQNIDLYVYGTKVQLPINLPKFYTPILTYTWMPGNSHFVFFSDSA